jgi:alkylated DNA repair dioxygenase AlkB
MKDLFSSTNLLEPIPLPDADVSYVRHFDLGLAPEVLMYALIAETPWRQENITVWGKTFRQPRLVAWYGDGGRSYHYSGIALEPLAWTGRILAVKARVEAAVGHSFNSVLLNYYRDQNDSMGFHSDDEKELGPKPVIASVSMGAERIFLLKSKLHPQAKPIRLPLASGSLFLMKGNTQKNYKHGISKERRPLGPRVNLTFRMIMA